jgi:hypothetical protein
VKSIHKIKFPFRAGFIRVVVWKYRESDRQIKASWHCCWEAFAMRKSNVLLQVAKKVRDGCFAEMYRIFGIGG